MVYSSSLTYNSPSVKISSWNLNFMLSSLKSKSRFWNSFAHLRRTLVISEVHFSNLRALWNDILLFWSARIIVEIHWVFFEVHLPIYDIIHFFLKYFSRSCLLFEVQIVFSDISHPFLKYNSRFYNSFYYFWIMLLFSEIHYRNLRKIWNLIPLFWILTSTFEVPLSHYEVNFFFLKNRWGFLK